MVEVGAFPSGRMDVVQGVNAFWVTSATPESRALLDKPDVNTYCPATGKKLRLKDLIPVKFTKASHMVFSTVDSSTNYYIGTYCPATGNKLRLKDLVPVKSTKVQRGVPEQIAGVLNQTATGTCQEARSVYDACSAHLCHHF